MASSVRNHVVLLVSNMHGHWTGGKGNLPLQIWHPYYRCMYISISLSIYITIYLLFFIFYKYICMAVYMYPCIANMNMCVSTYSGYLSTMLWGHPYLIGIYTWQLYQAWHWLRVRINGNFDRYFHLFNKKINEMYISTYLSIYE